MDQAIFDRQWSASGVANAPTVLGHPKVTMTNGGLRVELNGGAPYTPVVISVFHTQHRGRDAALRRPRAVQARNVRPSAGPPSQGQRARFRRCMRRGGRSAPSLTEFAGPALSKCEISGLKRASLTALRVMRLQLAAITSEAERVVV